jgi:MFS family permease
MTPLSPASALRRYLLLTALRWSPAGLFAPVTIFIVLDRGLTLSELGIVAATQGFVVFFLELPTGGLADAIGRRRVVLASQVVALAATVLFLVADSFAAFVAMFALTGIYRALDSGPLDAWYVDAVHAADPHAKLEKGLSAHGTVVGVSMAVGALASSALVALHPVPSVDPLLQPVFVALAIQAAALIVAWALMREPHRTSGLRALARSVRDTPRIIGEGVALLRRSRVLLALVSVELFWGFGMVASEALPALRIAEVTGRLESAAAVTGPVAMAGAFAAAGGAALTPVLGRRIGIASAAALMRILQGLTVVGIGLSAGLAGLIAAYIACYVTHGISNAAHMTLLHRQAEAGVRATVVSLNSWISQPAFAVGAIALSALAERTTVTTAILAGAVILALAAPLYLPAWRQSRMDTAARTREPEPEPVHSS